MLISSCIIETTPLSAQQIAWYCDMAWRAMLAEVELSPKPGLVDRYNCGAHRDMTLEDFHRSAAVIRGWLPRFIEFGAYSAGLLATDAMTGLRPLGMACEAEMFRVTGGVNTHKGSIFSLGLLCAAIGRLHQQRQPANPENLCRTVAAFCHGLTERELRQCKKQQTAGQRLYHQMGLTGARGEAEAGYPLVFHYGLPHYQALLAQGIDLDLALLDTLLLLMARNGDTNVAARGGGEGLFWLQQQARTLLDNGGIRQPADLIHLHRFNEQCVERNLSPGGSADLLIVIWFLARILPTDNYHKSMENLSEEIRHVCFKR